MACSVQGPSPRPRPRPHPRPGPGRSLDRNTGLDLEPRLSVKASNSVRTASRVPSLRRCQRTPLSRSPPQPLPPVRPRSPTPRVGRRSARRKSRHQRLGSAQCIAQARPVALGNRKTPGRSGRRSAATARALGRVPGEHCLPSDAPGQPSLAPRSPPIRCSEPRPAPFDWNPRPRSLESQNFPGLPSPLTLSTFTPPRLFNLLSLTFPLPSKLCNCLPFLTLNLRPTL